MSSSIAPTIRAEAVSKTYGEVQALNNLSLTVPSGDIVALLGKNGAGKTTFIDIALGLQRPTSGTCELFGMTPRNAIRRSLVGVVHQTGALIPDYTVAQTLHLFSSTHPTSLPVDQVMSETNLLSLASRSVRKLSGGEQQRVRLALALLPNPHLLILDEPTAGMDITARREFWDLMETQARQGRSILFATHYLAEAEDFAQRTVIMREGKIVADAPTAELIRQNTARTLRIVVPAASHDTVRRVLEGSFSADTSLSWHFTEENSDSSVLTLSSSHTDDVARALLSVPGTHNLEISVSSLEDVFTDLTA